MKKNLEGIIKNISTLEGQLGSLRSGFQDDGYYDIKTHITDATKVMETASPSFKIILEKLFNYGVLLKKAEDATANQHERFR
jgi:hypothetical protein